MQAKRLATFLAAAPAAGAVWAVPFPLDALSARLAASAPPGQGISLAEIDGGATDMFKLAFESMKAFIPGAAH
jgi:hypothetical protein